LVEARAMTRVVVVIGIAVAGAAHAQSFDVLIRNGTVYDGTGAPPIRADVAIRGDRVAGIGDYSASTAATSIDAQGLAVSPGFVNMLSHAPVTLLVDPRGMSDTLQGVTLEVFGESSMGPWNETMQRESRESQGDLTYEVAWSTLGEYFDHLQGRGITPNVCSFVAASTVRVNVLGRDDVAPTKRQLKKMKALVAQSMEDGAMGLTTALIYAPATYASTEELI
jgi:N-acyl-D-amino-acid deacylase